MSPRAPVPHDGHDFHDHVRRGVGAGRTRRQEAPSTAGATRRGGDASVARKRAQMSLRSPFTSLLAAVVVVAGSLFGVSVVSATPAFAAGVPTHFMEHYAAT